MTTTTTTTTTKYHLIASYFHVNKITGRWKRVEEEKEEEEKKKKLWRKFEYVYNKSRRSYTGWFMIEEGGGRRIYENNVRIKIDNKKGIMCGRGHNRLGVFVINGKKGTGKQRCWIMMKRYIHVTTSTHPSIWRKVPNGRITRLIEFPIPPYLVNRTITTLILCLRIAFTDEFFYLEDEIRSGYFVKETLVNHLRKSGYVNEKRIQVFETLLFYYNRYPVNTEYHIEREQLLVSLRRDVNVLKKKLTCYFQEKIIGGGGGGGGSFSSKSSFNKVSILRKKKMIARGVEEKEQELRMKIESIMKENPIHRLFFMFIFPYYPNSLVPYEPKYVSDQLFEMLLLSL